MTVVKLSKSGKAIQIFSYKEGKPIGKKCSRCGIIKPLSEFGVNRKAKHLVSYHCLKCDRKARKRLSEGVNGKKKCTYCYKALPLSCFDKSNKSKSGYKSCCKECAPSVKNSARRYRRKLYIQQRGRKLKLDLIKRFGDKCNICGNSFHPACYDFHHRDSKEKSYTLSKLMSSGRLTELYREADKCVMLCAHCHKVLHYEENTQKYEEKIEHDSN